jgi:methionyl-tRNA synthetase
MVEKEVQLLKETQAGNSDFEPVKEEISFDDFTKMDIRLGKILTAEKVKKADKLLHMTVDTGVDVRNVVSGIAEHYTPEEVVGKTVQVLMNLAPRKIRGIESQGMILMAENEKGELSFMSPEKEFDAGGGVR